MSEIDTHLINTNLHPDSDPQNQSTGRPTIALALPKPAMPAYSTTMDALACHVDGAVRAALGGFVHAFAPPAHGTRFREALARLDDGLVMLNDDLTEVQDQIDHAHQSLELLMGAIDVQEEAHAVDRPVDRWAAQHVQYGVLLKVPLDDSLSLMGLAAAYLVSLIYDKPISKQFCKAVASAARSSIAGTDESNLDQRPWHAKHVKHIHSIRRMGLDRRASDTGDFQRDACQGYVWRAKLPGRNVRLGLADARSLRLDEFKQVASKLREGLNQGDEVAVGVAAGWWSGLTWPLSKKIPLLAPDGDEWVIWLDAELGCYHVNLTPIARNAAVANGNTNYLPATKTYERHLPTQLAQALARTRQARPHAGTLGALTCTLDVPEQRAVGPLSDRVLKTSIARLYNSRAVVSRALGLDAPMSALVLGEFGRGAHSRLYYHAVSSRQLDHAQARVAELLDWGVIPCSPPDAPVIGSSVVPHAENLAAIATVLASHVAASRPPRRHTWQQVRDHHNAFARYTAYLVSLGILGRQRNTTVIVGGPWASQSGLCGVHDKFTTTSHGATIVAVCRPVRDQIDHWMRHLACLLDRMDRLGVSAPEVVYHVHAILSGNNASLVFTIDASDLPHDCGGNQAYRSVPEVLRVKADSARHLWESYFSCEQVDDMLAAAQARRAVRWAPYWQQTSTLSGTRLRMVIGSLQERKLNELGIHAIEGLQK